MVVRSVWTDGVDTVVAASAEEAVERSAVGVVADYGDLARWEALPPDKVLRIRFDEDDPPPIAGQIVAKGRDRLLLAPCREWVAAAEAGLVDPYIASTEA